MSEELKNDQIQTCPQCDDHCPVDALRCGKGRMFFGVEGEDHGHDHSHDHDHGHHHHGHEGVRHHKHEGHEK